MKIAGRAPLLLATFACLAITGSLGLSLAGYFHAVERGGSSTTSDKHLLTQLKAVHERLKAADSPEEAKASMKLVEGLGGYGAESDLARELKKAYGPVLAVFGSKPREAELRYTLAKKRELMETLVNAYRKEVLRGDIRVRAAYLNVLFDTQASLLNETDEAEQVYLKRNRERLDGLKGILGAGGDPGLPIRVNAIDGIFQSYERGFQTATKWRADKLEALAKLEKGLPSIAKSVVSNADSGVDESRRAFLYVCFVSLVVAGASFLSLLLGFKVIAVRSEIKLDAFLTWLRTFGTERADPQVERALETLREDAAWASVLGEAKRAEESFLRTTQDLLAVPRSLRTPFFVVGKDRAVRYWNESAGALFGLTLERAWGVEDLLTTERLGVKEGDAAPAVELVRSAFGGLTEDRFDLLVRDRDQWHPYDLTMSPVTSGPLAGGKIYLWREVKGEAERLERAVASQLERIRELVHKTAHQFEADLSAAETDTPPVRAMLGDLALLKGRIDEREILWKSEAQALIDQVTRQQDVLQKLTDEVGRIRTGHAEALDLVRSVHGGEEHLHDEVCVVERDLEKWTANRRRLEGDLQQQAAVLERARKFEEQLRTATQAVRADLDAWEKEVAELREFTEAAKVHSVNLSLARDPAYREFAARARAFAHDLSRFTASADALGRKVRQFVSAHPGGALAAHLVGPGLDQALLNGISEEQERLASFVKRWKESGETILHGGEKAVAILQEAEKQGAVVSQLGETSLLIGQQAKGNLERWN